MSDPISKPEPKPEPSPLATDGGVAVAIDPATKPLAAAPTVPAREEVTAKLPAAEPRPAAPDVHGLPNRGEHAEIRPFERLITTGMESAWWRRPANYVFAAAVLVVALWVLEPVLTPIASAFAVAYFVSPWVDSLEKRGVPRSASILAILVAGFALVAGVIAVLIPVLQSEIERLAANAPSYWDSANAWFSESLRPWVRDTLGYELPTTARDVWEQHKEKLQGAAPDIAGTVTKIVRDTLSNVFGLLGTLLKGILFPVFLFYILKDFRQIQAAMRDAVPPRHREFLFGKLAEVDRVIAAFARGQVKVCAILAVAYSAGLWLSGIDLAIAIGCLAGMASMIPYTGPIVVLIPGLAMGIARYGLFTEGFPFIEPHVLGVLITVGVVQLVESNVITPKIVGEQVGLHPIVMITAVIVGGTLFGFLGVLLAVPTTAAAAVFFWSAWDRYKKSDFYAARS